MGMTVWQMISRTAMWAAAATLVCAVPAAGCSGNKRDGDGLPPASDWHAPPPEAVAAAGGVRSGNPHANPHANPHDPHAGMMIGDPHAGMMMGDPHAGMSDVEGLGLPPPDPGRTIDPDKYLRGIIVAGKEVEHLVKPGQVLFLSVRQRDPATGQGVGPPIAVDRLDLTMLPAGFNLTGAQAMIGGTGFSGDVVITARVDQDGDAISKQPGDIEGSVAATIPADTLVLTLDTILQ
jgi:hypothetical protein